MGAKRPLQEEIFPGLLFKQPKQLDYLNQITLPTVDFSSFTPIVAADSPVNEKINFDKLQYDEKVNTYDAFVVEKELEESAPLSLVTSSSEENTGYEDSNFLSCFPRFTDFSIPRQQPVVEQVEDPYVSLLNNSPRKEVPIGPEHQAKIPECTGKEYYLSNSDANKQKLKGTSVIPMPDLNDSIINEVRVGCGRRDCSCMDAGSMRCVQQHVKEARENLRDTVGEDKFADVGIYNVGEEVACKWTVYEEQVFHEVVFSNPARHGGNFWMQLGVVFPTRTNMEIVSYYFNVFMLRRRAVQNRSYMLEIDSDDDEEHRGGGHGNFNENGSFLLDGDANGVEYNNDYDGTLGGCSYLVNDNEDDDSTVESFADKDLDTSWVDDDSWSGPENVLKQEVDITDQGRDQTSKNEDHEV